MIVCPSCRAGLVRIADDCHCPACDRSFLTPEGNVVFATGTRSPDFDPTAFTALAAAEGGHFWFRARNRVILELFRRYVGRAERTIEVGAGTGVVATALSAAGYQVAVGDVFAEALDCCRRQGLAERYQFDLLRSPFREEFDCVGLFDVLEHLADDGAAVAAVGRMLRGHGRVVLTVPAYPWLWSQSDVAARHKRRYRFDALRRLFESGGFHVLREQGFFISLLPALALRRLLYPAGAPGPSSTGLRIAPVANGLVLGILTVEHGLSRSAGLMAGASIAMVAQKR